MSFGTGLTRGVAHLVPEARVSTSETLATTHLSQSLLIHSMQMTVEGDVEGRNFQTETFREALRES